jgi:O-antigen biosynthesis protein WbqP
MLDVVYFVVSVLLLCVPMLIIATLIKLTSHGPVLHRFLRIGKDNRIFKMPKFRTMHVDAPAVATHLLKNPLKYLTPFGRFLRKFSIDELPQLWSVLEGDMKILWGSGVPCL